MKFRAGAGHEAAFATTATICWMPLRLADDLVRAMGMSGISKSQVNRLCEEIDDQVKAFLGGPLEGDRPYL
jgi:transposase-like protein